MRPHTDLYLEPGGVLSSSWALSCDLHFRPSQAVGLGYPCLLSGEMGAQRGRITCRGHMVSRWQSWDSDLGTLALGPPSNSGAGPKGPRISSD